MFTQSMPALAQALAGALPEAAIRQLMQSLGNCQQPLTHRGEVNLQPMQRTGAGGLARGGTWRASDYSDLLPNAGANVFYDIASPSVRNTVNSSNYGGHQFNFPINQGFAYNNYYGGETFNVAGNSTFESTNVYNFKADNSTINNLTVRNINYITPEGTPTAGPPTEGGGSGEPGGGGGGMIPSLGGGGPIGVPIPAANQVSTFLKDVTVRGTVNVNEAGAAVVKNTAVDVTNKLTNKTVTSKGTITLPTVDGVYLKSFTGAGTASITTLTGGTISGGAASGNISYDNYPTATLGEITGNVSIFSSGTFSGTPTGIAVAATVGTLAGTVVVPTVTGGYLDASCNLKLTYGTTTATVNFAGTPGVTISSQGSVSGNVSLTGSTTRSLTISTPSIKMNKATGTAAASLSVSGITFSPTTGSTSASISLTDATATFGLTNGSQTQDFDATGTVSVNEANTAVIREPAVTITPVPVTKKLNIIVGKRSDFIVYLRPRM